MDLRLQVFGSSSLLHLYGKLRGVSKLHTGMSYQDSSLPNGSCYSSGGVLADGNIFSYANSGGLLSDFQSASVFDRTEVTTSTVSPRLPSVNHLSRISIDSPRTTSYGTLVDSSLDSFCGAGVPALTIHNPNPRLTHSGTINPTIVDRSRSSAGVFVDLYSPYG